jgi:hypothetical protein
MQLFRANFLISVVDVNKRAFLAVFVPSSILRGSR